MFGFGKPVPEVTVQEVKNLVDSGGIMVVDIRDRGTFQAGSLPGAIHASELSTALQKTDPTTPIVVVCYHGNSSKAATRQLISQGFTEAKSLRGGYAAWSMGR